MSFSPDTLKSLLDSPIAGGPAQSCHFATIIQPCRAMLSSVTGAASGIAAAFALNILNEEASLPGRQFATTDHTMYGTRVKMPYGVVYDDLTLTFICSNNMLERYYFDEWQRCVSDPTNNYFNYYDDYVSDIQIMKLRPDGTSNGLPTYLMTIEEAYPIAIQTQELSYSSDSYMKLSVQFAYRRWRNVVDRIVGGGLSGVASGGSNSLGGLTDPFQNGSQAAENYIRGLLGR